MNDDANRRSWQLVEAVGVFTAVVAQAAHWLDVFAIMDGPGTGFGDRVPGSSLCGASVLALCFPLAARFYKAGGIGWLLGLVLGVVVGCGGGSQRLMEWCWARRCERGEGIACYAYGNVFAVGLFFHLPDDRRARGLYVRACELGDSLGCERAVACGGMTASEACASMRSACARDPSQCYGARQCDEQEAVDDAASHPPR
jgi:hypothetical protein